MYQPIDLNKISTSFTSDTVENSPQSLLEEANEYLAKSAFRECGEMCWGAGAMTISWLAQQNRIELRSDDAFSLLVQYLSSKFNTDSTDNALFTG